MWDEGVEARRRGLSTCVGWGLSTCVWDEGFVHVSIVHSASSLRTLAMHVFLCYDVRQHCVFLTRARLLFVLQSVFRCVIC